MVAQHQGAASVAAHARNGAGRVIDLPRVPRGDLGIFPIPLPKPQARGIPREHVSQPVIRGEHVSPPAPSRLGRRQGGLEGQHAYLEARVLTPHRLGNRLRIAQHCCRVGAVANSQMSPHVPLSPGKCPYVEVVDPKHVRNRSELVLSVDGENGRFVELGSSCARFLSACLSCELGHGTQLRGERSTHCDVFTINIQRHTRHEHVRRLLHRAIRGAQH
eukprot:scaffold243949_cov36-Tisochrysis_lutea.AAC.4